VSLLDPGRNDPARRAARRLAYRLILLSECKRPPAPGARTNLLLQLWRRADDWPQSRLGGMGLPGENCFLRWLIGDDARARAVIAAARLDRHLQRALDELAERARRARRDAAGPRRGPAGLAGSLLWAERNWYSRLPL
jgi:hypothetical protein